MPATLNSGDRKLLLAGGAVLLLLTAALALVGADPEQQGRSFPSSYSTGSDGARAAYDLLQDLHYKVSRWEQSPTELPEDPGGIVLVIADPFESPTKEERTALQDFVEGGGQILFTGGNIKAFFSEGRVAEQFPTLEWKGFVANFPSNYSVGAQKIVMQTGNTWKVPENSQLPLYGNVNAPVAICWRMGEGHILWWAEATPLTNAGIAREGNLNLFLNAMHLPWGGELRAGRIYWDEYFHGERTSLWSYFQKTPLAWGLAQLGVLAVIFVFTFGRRSGPTVMPPVVSRLSPLEFVDTLGGLYERAGAESAVVGFVYQRFRATLTRQLRLPVTVGDTELADAVQARLGWKESGLKTTLARAVVASRSKKVAPGEALKLITEMERYEEQLGLRKNLKKEQS